MPYRYGTDARYRVPAPPRVTAPRAPNNRAGMLGPAPFPTLARSLAPAPRATSPFTSAYGAPRSVSSAPATTAPPRAAPVAAPAQPNTNPAAPTVAYDYSADPVLNQIQAIGVQDRATAQANALRLKKQTAIDYGDPDLGGTIDEATAQAAAGNPFGVRQQLQRNYATGLTGLEDQYNKANLFYSGARAKGLGEAATNYQGALAGAAGQEQGALTGIESNLATANSAADARDIQAQQDAADRALQQALLYGIDPGAGGAAAGPVDVAASPLGGPDAGAAGAGALGGETGQPSTPLLAMILGQAAQQEALRRARAGYNGPIGGPRQAQDFF